MHATEVIESYIDDTVRLLPVRQRDDVASELRSLLNEELHSRARESARPPDESLALSDRKRRAGPRRRHLHTECVRTTLQRDRRIDRAAAPTDA